MIRICYTNVKLILLCNDSLKKKFTIVESADILFIIEFQKEKEQHDRISKNFVNRVLFLFQEFFCTAEKSDEKDSLINRKITNKKLKEALTKEFQQI